MISTISHFKVNSQAIKSFLVTMLISSSVLYGNAALSADSKSAGTPSVIFSAICTSSKGELIKSAKISNMSTIPTGAKYAVLVTLENDKITDGLFYVDPMTRPMSKLLEDAFLLGTRVDVCLQGYSEITGVGKAYNIMGAHSSNK